MYIASLVYWRKFCFIIIEQEHTCLDGTLGNMAVWVVEFSNRGEGGTKLEIFCLRINILKGSYLI